jgi:hypothetical protein
MDYGADDRTETLSTNIVDRENMRLKCCIVPPKMAISGPCDLGVTLSGPRRAVCSCQNSIASFLRGTQLLDKMCLQINLARKCAVLGVSRV